MSNSLIQQFYLIQCIRDIFKENDFIDVITPPIVENPGMETHIHPFKLMSASNQKATNKYLHTSPEFHMKELLANETELNNIFTLSYAFRDEPNSPIHRSQFLMLEWYRRGAHYEKIMEDVQNLIKYSSERFLEKGYLKENKFNSFPQVTISELFLDILKMDILSYLDKTELKNKIRKDFPDVPLPSVECSWDDYFFLLFLNKIEPHFKNYPYLLVKEFPAPLSALSTLSPKDERVCERFEVYLSGVELCNCFNELTNAKELELRFKSQMKEKKAIYNYELPWPKRFMDMMEKGYPQSAGIALGVERLLYSLIEQNPFYD